MNEKIRKPNIERTIMAMKGQIPDRVPNYEVCIEENNVKAILGRDAGSTLAGSRGASDSQYFSPPMDPKDYIEICNAVGQDVIGFEAIWAPFKYEDEKGNRHLITDGRMKTWESFEKSIKPNWEEDYKPRKEYLDLYCKAVKGTNIGTFLLTGCLFQSAYQFVCGFGDFFEMCYTEPELVDAILDEMVKYYVKITEMAVDAGISFMFFADDVAYKSGTFINPVKFKEIWYPKYMQIMQPAKDAGVPIMFHSCGNLTNIMDDVIMQMGIDCLNPIEPYSMDIYEIKKKYGDKICISGNIDIAGPLAFGSPDDVKKVVREQLEKLMVGGRYILSTSHSITIDIPPENYRAMLDTLFEHGVYHGTK